MLGKVPKPMAAVPTTTFSWRGTLQGELDGHDNNTTLSFNQDDLEAMKSFTQSIPRRLSFWYPRNVWPSQHPPDINAPRYPAQYVPEPMPPWAESEWRGVSWTTQIDNTFRLLQDVSFKRYLSSESLEAITGLTLRGITDTVGDLKGAFTITAMQPEILKAPANYWVPEGCNIVRGSFEEPLSCQKNINSDLSHRRWWTMRYHFTDEEHGTSGHWAAAVLDRRTATLYYIDTISNGRDRRALAAGLQLRCVLAAIGLPRKFTIIAPGYTDQYENWESGLLSQFILHQMIRCSIGVLPLELSATQYLKGADNVQEHSGWRHGELRIQDWTTVGPQDKAPTDDVRKLGALENIRKTMVGMICHELGITGSHWSNGDEFVEGYSIGAFANTATHLPVQTSRVLGTIIPMQWFELPNCRAAGPNIWGIAPGIPMRRHWTTIPQQTLSVAIPFNMGQVPQMLGERLVNGTCPEYGFSNPLFAASVESILEQMDVDEPHTSAPNQSVFIIKNRSKVLSHTASMLSDMPRQKSPQLNIKSELAQTQGSEMLPRHVLDPMYQETTIASVGVGDLHLQHHDVAFSRQLKQNPSWKSDNIGDMTRLMVAIPGDELLKDVHNLKGYFCILHRTNNRETFISVMPQGMVDPEQWRRVAQRVEQHLAPPAKIWRARTDGRPTRQQYQR